MRSTHFEEGPNDLPVRVKLAKPAAPVLRKRTKVDHKQPSKPALKH